MSQSGEFDIVFKAGTTYRRAFTYRDKETQAPIPLTGATVRAQARPSVTAGSVLLDLTQYLSVPPSEAANGRYVLNIPAADSAQLLADLGNPPEVRGVYDLEIEFSTGDVEDMHEGAVRIRNSSTRTTP